MPKYNVIFQRIETYTVEINASSAASALKKLDGNEWQFIQTHNADEESFVHIAICSADKSGKYEILCLDECGHEMVAFEGSYDQCQEKMRTIQEEYPECRNFNIVRNAREAAEERIRDEEAAEACMEDDDPDQCPDDPHGNHHFVQRDDEPEVFYCEHCGAGET